jgi:uncharacterized protein (TIGR00730 family)
MPSEPVPVLFNDQEALLRVLSQSVYGLWKVVNDITSLRPKRSKRYRVTIFGSARVGTDLKVYQDVRRLAAALAAMGCDIITGGGPGLMQAANEGATEGDPDDKIRSVGIRIQLPFEQGSNPSVEDEYEHGTFFTRLHHFVLASDAFVAVPGGIGTVLEAMMVWQLLQVGHLPKRTPLILLGDMWPDLIGWGATHLRDAEPALISPPDLQIPSCAATVEEAVALLRARHEEWLAEGAAAG